MIRALLANEILVSVMITMAVCELWKFIDYSVRKKRVDLRGFVVTGGMPSSHAVFVCVIATSIGLVEGFLSTVFLLSAGLAIVVVRDAFGVRRDVDTLAGTVNSIIRHKKLGIKEFLRITGHSPVQVVTGIVLGIVSPVIIHLLYYAV